MLVSAAVDVVSVVTPPYLHCKHFLGEGLPTAEVVSAVLSISSCCPSIIHHLCMYAYTHIYIYMYNKSYSISRSHATTTDGMSSFGTVPSPSPLNKTCHCAWHTLIPITRQRRSKCPRHALGMTVMEMQLRPPQAPYPTCADSCCASHCLLSPAQQWLLQP